MNFIRKISHFKGSNFLIPMFLTSLVYTFYPDLLTIGAPFSGLFTSEATFFIIAVLLMVSGIQTDWKKYPSVLKSIGPVLLVKVAISAAVTLLWKAIFPVEGWLGMTVVTVCAVLMSCNPGMYLVLLGKNITEKEESAFSVINLLMLPALPLLILSIGESQIDLLAPLVANLLPFILGIVIGMLYPGSRKLFRPLNMLLIPFLAVTFGAKINLLVALKSSLSGFILAILFYALMVLPLTWLDKVWNKQQGRMALSMSSIAAFSMSIPPFVSQYLQISDAEIGQSIGQIAFAVIISSFATPYLFNQFISSEEEEVETETLHYIRPHSDYPEYLVDQIAAVDWRAGEHLANRIRQHDLDTNDVVVVMADDNNKLVGFVGLTERDIVDDVDFGSFLSTMYIVPEHRGKGFSFQLTSCILEIAKKQGRDKLYIVTQQEGLYEHHDFQQISEATDRFGRPMRVLMREI